MDELLRDRGGRRYVRRQQRLQEIRDALEAQAPVAEELESLGASALQQGDYDVAELYLREACLSRRDPTAMARFGQLMERDQEPERAMRAYEFALAQGLHSPRIALSLAALYERRRRFEDAHKLATRMLEQLEPAEGAVFDSLRRRVETKLGLRRHLEQRREQTPSAAGKAASGGPESVLLSLLEALRADDLQAYLELHARTAKTRAERERPGIRAALADAQRVVVGGASDEGGQIRLRARVERRGRPDQGLEALLGREGGHWRLLEVRLSGLSQPSIDT